MVFYSFLGVLLLFSIVFLLYNRFPIGSDCLDNFFLVVIVCMVSLYIHFSCFFPVKQLFRAVSVISRYPPLHGQRSQSRFSSVLAPVFAWFFFIRAWSSALPSYALRLSSSYCVIFPTTIGSLTKFYSLVSFLTVARYPCPLSFSLLCYMWLWPAGGAKSKGSTAVAVAEPSEAAVPEREATDEDPREHLNLVFIGHGQYLQRITDITAITATDITTCYCYYWYDCMWLVLLLMLHIIDITAITAFFEMSGT